MASIVKCFSEANLVVSIKFDITLPYECIARW